MNVAVVSQFCPIPTNEISSNPKSLLPVPVFWLTMQIEAVVFVPEFQVVENCHHTFCANGAVKGLPKLVPLIEN